MKNHLGKIYLLLLFPLYLFGDSQLASYTQNISKKELFVKEATQITITVAQKDYATAMFFQLEPQKNDAYEIILLDQVIKKVSLHNSSTTYRYLLFPLKSGELHIGFDCTIRLASDNALIDGVLGGHDDVTLVKTVDKKIPIEPITLHVSPLSEKIDLIGDFTLDANLQKSDINQYGSANIRYTLKGTGYVEKALQPLRNITDVSSFSQVTDILSKATQNGYELNREYSYALSSKKNFTIPAMEIKAYSPKQKRYYTLKTQSYNIKVSAIDPSTLLDNKESPETKSYDFTALRDIGIAVLIFLAGFTSAKIAPSLSFKRVKKQAFWDIKESKTPKKLILVLLQNYKTPIVEKYIKELELLEYKKSERSFQSIKTDVLKDIM